MYNKIGLYFGSFNPIHEGHFYVINNALKTTIDKLYLVVSPQSPFKPLNELAPFEDRLEMARLAIKEHGLEDKVEAVNWEEHMYPSYTAQTLKDAIPMLSEKDVVIFMGLDNFLTIDKWKEPKYILENYSIFVIPRDCNDTATVISNKKQELITNITSNIKSIGYSNPLESFKMAATDIRLLIDLNQPTDGMLVKSVREYIDKKKLYISNKKTLF